MFQQFLVEIECRSRRSNRREGSTAGSGRGGRNGRSKQGPRGQREPTPLSAAEGKALGFVNDVVPVGQALASALEWARTIASNSPQSIRTSLDVVRRSLDIASLEASIEEPYASVQALRDGLDAIEGPLAFAEKRAPKWAD